MKTFRGNTLRILAERTDSDDLQTLLLANRHLPADPERLRIFFSPTLDDLHDPFLFVGMDRAVARILLARDQRERVIIFGDYDVDGVSSTALLVRYLRTIGIEVSYRLPHRVHDGYGFRRHFVDDLAAKWVKLVITVDCGTRDVDTIAYARSLGIDTIVTDHHAIPQTIPDVVALLNPKMPESGYPCHHLAGSGVAFKLLCAIAITIEGHEKGMETAESFIDFAMLGTIADCMPLTDENRTIASLGLRAIRQSRSDGLLRLIEDHGGKDEMDGDLVGFFIGPRINAAGRMDTPYKALQLLLGTVEELDPIITEIESLNTLRKSTTEGHVRDALATIEPSDPLLWYVSSTIEHGVLGLISGRLTEMFNRPTITVRDDGEKLVGSCRSPEYCDIIGTLELFRDEFISFGGHRQAAGFTISREKWENFKKNMTAKIAEMASTHDIGKIIEVDTTLRPRDITLGLTQMLDTMKPYGIGNRRPTFLIPDIIPSGVEYIGRTNTHLKIHHPLSRDFDIVAFGWGEHRDQLREARSLDIVGELDVNEWNGRRTISVRMRDCIIHR